MSLSSWSEFGISWGHRRKRPDKQPKPKTRQSGRSGGLAADAVSAQCPSSGCAPTGLRKDLNRASTQGLSGDIPGPSQPRPAADQRVARTLLLGSLRGGTPDKGQKTCLATRPSALSKAQTQQPTSFCSPAPQGRPGSCPDQTRSLFLPACALPISCHLFFFFFFLLNLLRGSFCCCQTKDLQILFMGPVANYFYVHQS